MKGVKECINWLIDNEGKELKCKNQNVYKETIKYGLYFDPEYLSEAKGIYWSKNKYAVAFELFDDYEWEEVIEPVDFITAYQDCLENGTKYVVKGTTDNIASIYNVNGDVQIHTLVHGFTLSDKWIKE